MPPPHIEPQKFLSHLPLFRELGTAEIDRIAAGTHDVRLARGATLFVKGDPCTGFHAIVYGQIKLTVTAAHGGEKVIEVIGDGQTFGEAVMFLDKPYIVSSQALVDTLLLHISKAAVFNELACDPRLARRIIAGLSARLHHLVRDVEAYSLHSGRERVVGYLLHHEAAHGGRSGNLTLPTRKGIVASRLNLTQEHFSRILRDLVEQGLIEVRGREIAIPDIKRLRQYDPRHARATAAVTSGAAGGLADSAPKRSASLD